MLTLNFLYKHWNPGYESLSDKDQKRARVAARKRIVDACNLTTNTATYQWQKNGGVIPLPRAIELSIHDKTIPVDVTGYLNKSDENIESVLSSSGLKVSTKAA
jgi:hypothetical protein